MSDRMDIREDIFAEEIAKKVLSYMETMEENNLKIEKLKETVESGTYAPDDHEIAMKILEWRELQSG